MPTELPQKNKVNISDLMASFSHSSEGGDEELLRIASNYALQISPDQISTIMKLKMFALDYRHLNKDLPAKIEIFIKEYLEIKHYHESGSFIERIIGSLSLKRIIPQDAVKVNVMKQQ